MSWIEAVFPNLNHSFAIKFVLSPYYLTGTMLIVGLIWIRRGREQNLIEFMLPRSIYKHASNWVDIKLAIFNTLFLSTGAFSTLFFTPWVTLKVHAVLLGLSGYTSTEISTTRMFVAGIVLFLSQDFCRYCLHYVHHKNHFFWPFHAVHHSAEVMTPITFMRAHPMYSVLQAILISILVGFVQAIVLFALVRQISPGAVYAGTYAFSIYIFFGGHLRHSHIWLSYGRTIEHFLISPAQHQIHHSSDVKHHDKNYGEIFAIWDWMFGTLYIPDGKEELKFGLANHQGTSISQPYPTLRDALVGPFKEVWHKIKDKKLI